jgi:hypothetical protein
MKRAYIQQQQQLHNTTTSSKEHHQAHHHQNVDFKMLLCYETFKSFPTKEYEMEASNFKDSVYLSFEQTFGPFHF